VMGAPGENLMGLKTVALKDLCTRLGTTVSGTKTTLVGKIEAKRTLIRQQQEEQEAEGGSKEKGGEMKMDMGNLEKEEEEDEEENAEREQQGMEENDILHDAYNSAASEARYRSQRADEEDLNGEEM
jgi:hypothetical protein